MTQSVGSIMLRVHVKKKFMYAKKERLDCLLYLFDDLLVSIEAGF